MRKFECPKSCFVFLALNLGLSTGPVTGFILIFSIHCLQKIKNCLGLFVCLLLFSFLAYPSIAGYLKALSFPFVRTAALLAVHVRT